MNIIKYNELARFNYGWLDTRHHFSFASYYDPNNMKYGNIRVVNDDIVTGGKGFDTHPHQNMEIISYVVSGKLTHKDSIGNEQTLERGNVQYMSAGTGVWHSEYNKSSEKLRFFQIWILPDANGYTPQYGDFRPNFDLRKNKWLPLVSQDESLDAIHLHSEVEIDVALIDNNTSLDLLIKDGWGVYIINVEGELIVGDQLLNYGDALTTERSTLIQSPSMAHVLVLKTKL